MMLYQTTEIFDRAEGSTSYADSGEHERSPVLNDKIMITYLNVIENI